MAKFDINIKNVTSYVNKLNNDINDYKESYLDLVRNLNKVDTAWIDNNTNFFIDNVKRDKEIITSHLQIMKKYSDNISYFLNSLESTIKSVLNVGSVSKIRFDSNKIYSIINHVNNIAEYINNCITIYNYMSIPLKFKYRNKVYEVVCNLETARNRIIRLNSDLIKLNNKIIQALNDSIVKNNKTDFIVVDSRVCKYNWKVFTPTKLKSIDNILIEAKKYKKVFIYIIGTQISTGKITSETFFRKLKNALIDNNINHTMVIDDVHGMFIIPRDYSIFDYVLYTAHALITGFDMGFIICKKDDNIIQGYLPNNWMKKYLTCLKVVLKRQEKLRMFGNILAEYFAKYLKYPQFSLISNSSPQIFSINLKNCTFTKDLYDTLAKYHIRLEGLDNNNTYIRFRAAQFLDEPDKFIPGLCFLEDILAAYNFK